MIRGEIKREDVSLKDIYSTTQNGWDIFTSELGRFPVGRTFNSPLRKDVHPSFTIHCKKGVWRYKDFSTGDSGDAVEYIQQKYSLDFIEALQYIKNIENVNKGTIKISKAPHYETKEIHIAFTSCKFDDKHSAYWNSYGISEEFLIKNNIFRVKDLAINYRKVPLKKDELTYCYYAEDIDRCKILRIGVKKEDKWRTNCPHNYIWFLKSIDSCDKLVVSKSVKDAIVLQSLGVCSVATQSENAAIFDDVSVVDTLEGLSDDIIVNFGSDSQAKRESLKITEKCGWRHYNTPDYLLSQDINDISEWRKKDEKALIEHLKEKNIL